MLFELELFIFYNCVCSNSPIDLAIVLEFQIPNQFLFKLSQAVDRHQTLADLNVSSSVSIMP